MVKFSKYIFSDNGMKIIGYIITIIISFITAKLTSKNSYKNLITQYFKEQSVETQEKVLKFWCGLFMGNFNIIETYYNITNKEIKISNFEKQKEETRILIEIQKESFMCCSKKTIKAIKDYMRHIYRHEKDHSDKINQIQLVLIARIICRMKKDFTGEKANVLDLLRIKIKDFNYIKQIKSIIVLLKYNFRNIFY